VSLALRLLAQELRLSLRHGADTLAAVLFFVLAASLLPLALGPNPRLLAALAPGIVWVTALLAMLLPLDRLFGADYDDGSLDLLLLSGLPPSVVAIIKAAAHWCATGLPLIVAAVPVALMYGMPAAALPVLLTSLLIGTPTLSLIGTLGAAIVVGARRGGVLLPLLTLPLCVPVLVFGAAAAGQAAIGAPFAGALLLEAAILAAALPLCPLAAGAALRNVP